MYEDARQALAAEDVQGMCRTAPTWHGQRQVGAWAGQAARRARRSRFAGLWLFMGFFLLLSLGLRCALALRCLGQVEWTAGLAARVFATGALFDGIACLCLACPVAAILALSPRWTFRSRPGRILCAGLMLVGATVILFDTAAEWVFWSEFGSRFNFIAVDYLVYTHEVVANIWESYPIVAVLAGIAVLAAALVFAAWKCARPDMSEPGSIRSRLAVPGVLAALAAGGVLFVPASLTSIPGEYCAGELAKNGPYSLVLAFRDNIIDYDRFYLTSDDDAAFARLREMVHADRTAFCQPGGRDIARRVVSTGPERRDSVMLIVVESLSARFLGALGSPEGLTPHLDRISGQGLLFTRFLATGTRTVRGMEAIVLSAPPTPGRSLVKRPGCGGVGGIGPILKQRGYDTRFLYGGNGFFDNMNAFFEGNGFDVIDQDDFASDEITFSNAWGACDEDLFGKTLKLADESWRRGRPFFHFIMTTSNHRPYTYPDVIDIPSGTGRAGAVKYTDHAIGRFLASAAQRPWFKDTLFVIVADHCASSAGRVEVPVARYHIPLIVYAPGLVKPGKVDTLASQMDLAPTLLGMLNLSYTSRLFGRDLLRDKRPGRALLGNYQSIGLLRDGKLQLLLPKRRSCCYTVDEKWQQRLVGDDPALRSDAAAYYQCAFRLWQRHRQRRHASP